MDRATRIKNDPFLLPTCTECDGPLQLAYIEPAIGSVSERWVYRCDACNLEQEQNVRASGAGKPPT